MDTLELIPVGEDQGLRVALGGRAPCGDRTVRFAEPHLQWLRAGTPAARPRDTRPLLLRYRADDFMDRFLAHLAAPAPAPWKVVDPDDALTEPPGPEGQALRRLLGGDPDPDPEEKAPYKLFQPLHGDFHLACATLVHERPGWGEVCPAPRGGTAWAVLRRRRVVPTMAELGVAARRVEEAWVPDVGWVALGPWASPGVDPGEERLPAHAYATASGRTVLAAYVPTASRETYTAGKDDPLSPAGASLHTLRVSVEEALRASRTVGADASAAFVAALEAALAHEPALSKVAEKLATGSAVPLDAEELAAFNFLTSDIHDGRSLADILALPPGAPRPDLTPAAWMVAHVSNSVGSLLGDGAGGPVREAAEALWTARQERLALSWRTAWTLLRLLEGHVPHVVVSALGPAEPQEPPLEGEAAALRAALQADVLGRLPAFLEPHGSVPLADVLTQMRAARDQLLRTAADDAAADNAAGLYDRDAALAGLADAVPAGFRADLTDMDPGIVSLFRSILEAQAENGPVVPRFPPQPSAFPRRPEEDGGVHFVVRFAWEKPGCLVPHRLYSAPSEPFVLAPPFDPDAPARDLRIALPVDLSKEALAKARKGVGLMMSDKMRQAFAIGEKGPTALVTPSQGPSFELGALVTLSIPIVTICAMILLLIIATILHMVFQWLPYLIQVIPLKVKVRA